MRRRPMLVAGILLASLAPGSAAEPGTRLTPAATEGLRPCPGGGFVLPGSTACIRLGGSLATEMTLRSGPGSGPAAATRSRLFSGGVQGRVAADIRVPTEAGPLRAFVAIRGRTAPLSR